MAHSFADHVSRVLRIVATNASAALLASAPAEASGLGLPSTDWSRAGTGRLTWPLALRVGRRP